jgi:hypothetical protein
LDPKTFSYSVTTTANVTFFNEDIATIMLLKMAEQLSAPPFFCFVVGNRSASGRLQQRIRRAAPCNSHFAIIHNSAHACKLKKRLVFIQTILFPTHPTHECDCLTP